MRLQNLWKTLEKLMLELLDLPLEGSMLIFFVLLLISLGLDIAEEVTKSFLFAISLLDTTI